MLRSIAEPAGVRTGERVLYKLKDDRGRREPSAQELDQMRRRVVEVAKGTGVQEADVTFEPPVTSGLPYPRLIVLPGSEIIWDKDLRGWLESDDPLPSRDFPLEWALGVLHTSSERVLLYLDFTHPKVKAVFRVFYEFEYGDVAAQGPSIRERFREFREEERDLKAQVERRPDVLWAKIVQVDREPLAVRIEEARRGRLT